MHLFLIRHGESVSNREGRWQGQSDSPLSGLGRAQARQLGERFSRQPFDRVISSDLTRAAQTAQALSGRVRLDPEWREISLGRWEGLTREEVAQRYPEEADALARGRDLQIGGGERWSDVARRAFLAYQRLADDADRDERVAVVCHGGVIISLMSVLLDITQLRPRRIGKLGNTSVTQLFVHRGRVSMHRYNDLAHDPDRATWRLEAKPGRRVLGLQVGDGELDDLPDGGLHEAAVGADTVHALANRAARGPTSVVDLAPPVPGRRAWFVEREGEISLFAWNEGAGAS